MLENRIPYTFTDAKLIERLVDDDNLVMNHMVLPPGESIPIHTTNSNIYMIVIRGELSLALETEPVNTWPAGSIICIPYNLKMHPHNAGNTITEFFVVKAPNPKNMLG